MQSFYKDILEHSIKSDKHDPWIFEKFLNILKVQLLFVII